MAVRALFRLLPLLGLMACLAAEAATPSFEQRFRSARDLATSGKRAEAIAAYSELLVDSPRDSDVLIARGRVYTWDDQYALAEADFKAATVLSPGYADAWSAMGDMYLWSDRPRDAELAYGRWIKLKANQPEPYLARAKARRAAGNRTGAAQDEAAAVARGWTPPAPPPEGGALSPDAAASGHRWSASLSGSRAWFDPGSDRTDFGLSLRRHFEHGSLAAELLDGHQFGSEGQALAADAYVDLWSRAYANLRYQELIHRGLFADQSGRVELYQGVGKGWELAGSWDWLKFGSSTIDLYGLAVGKYVGNWYLRGRTVYIPSSGTNNYRVLARYYYAGDGDNYVEGAAGTGRTPEDLNQGQAASSSRSLSVAWVYFWTPRWGFKAGADVGTAGSIDERGASLALYTRW